MWQFIALFFLISCGGSDSEELNKNNVTLDPVAGQYQFRPWVVMTKEENGLGSGVMKIKTPGSTTFESASICPPSIIIGADIFSTDCAEITESGALSHYLENTGGQSDEKTAEYILDLQQHNITLGKLDSATSTLATEEYIAQEIDTICYLSDTKMNTVIQFTSEKLQTDYIGYLIFSVNSPEQNKEITINQDNTDLSVTLSIIPKSDKAPTYSSYIDDSYSTFQSLDFSTGARPNASCTIKVDDFNRNGLTKGSISCQNLANYDTTVDSASNKIPFGKNIQISSDWQCDGFKEGAY